MGYGWRGRIGLIVPSPDTTAEAEFWKLVPPGVSVHVARMHYPKTITIEAHDEMEKDSVKAARDLTTGGVNLILYGCTSGSFFRGREGERETVKRLEEASGLPVITTSMAVVEALNALGAKKIVIATPYPAELDEREKTFFEAFDFDVVKIKGMGISDSLGIGWLGPEESYRLARSIASPAADAIFISCMNLRTVEILEALERDTGKPAVSSSQASMWLSLRALGIKDPVKGYGSLLEDTSLRGPFDFWKKEEGRVAAVRRRKP